MTQQDELVWLYNPRAKPAKELSKHDQEMIQLGWDAAAVYRLRQVIEWIGLNCYTLTDKENCTHLCLDKESLETLKKQLEEMEKCY